MRKSSKKIVSFITSICLLSTLSAFSVSADETQVAGMDTNDTNEIVSQIVDANVDSQPIETSPVVVDSSVAVDTSLQSSETTVSDTLNIQTSIDEVETTLDTLATFITTDGSSTVTSSDGTTDSSILQTTIDGTAIVTTLESSTEETIVTTERYISKDIILDLDISGSMAGDPMSAMQSAAIDFCTKLLNADSDARISIVTFDDNAEVGVKFTNDLDEIKNYINGLTVGGLTNMYDSFEQVKILLETGSGETKNVIIMADGMPCEGNTSSSGKYDSYQNGALNFDNSDLKPLATIYTIGFFHNNYSDSDDEEFMKDLASDSSKYYNADINNLNQVFDQIVYEIEPKTNPNATESNNSKNDIVTTVAKNTNSPETSDNGVSSIVVLTALAGTMLVVTRKNNK